jgi:hypothetical protein
LVDLSIISMQLYSAFRKSMSKTLTREPARVESNARLQEDERLAALAAPLTAARFEP